MRCPRPVSARIAIALAIVLAVAHTAFALWLTRSGGPLPPDAEEYAEVARNLVRGQGYTINLVEIHPGLLPRVRHLHELHGLLQPFLLAPLFLACEPSNELVRVPSMLFVGLTGLATYGVARLSFGPAAGLLALGILLARRDIALDATLSGDDLGWMFFSTASVYAFDRARRDGSFRWLNVCGGCAALACLQKFIGVVLPLVFAPVLLLDRGRRFAGVACPVARLAGPTMLCVATYLLRNHLLHGGIGFRYGALDWMWKDSLPNYFAYYPEPRGVLRTWQLLGFGRVCALIAQQVSTLGSLVLEDPVAFIGGPICLVLECRRAPVLSGVCLTYSIALGLVVCIPYHVEARYLFALHPLFAAALAGSVMRAVRLLSVRSALARVSGAMGLFATCGLVAVHAQRALGLEVDLARLAALPGACDDALDFIKRRVPPDDAILTSSPWAVTWLTDRAAVNVPTNGPEAVLAVARHYDARWAITDLPSFGTADVGAALAGLKEGDASVTAAFDGARCDVYRVAMPAPPRELKASSR